MRTGLIPNAHATVEDAAFPVGYSPHVRSGDRVRPGLYPSEVYSPGTLRRAMAHEAVILDEVIEAAKAGKVNEVIRLGRRLDQTHAHTRRFMFDTSVA